MGVGGRHSHRSQHPCSSCASEIARLLAADAYFAKAVESVARLEVFQLEQLAHFYLCILAFPYRVWKAPGPFQRLGARFHLDERVTGDQLLALCERSVAHRAFLAGIADAPTLGARLQSRAIEQHASLCQLLVVGRHRGHHLLVGKHTCLAVLASLDDDHESHWYLLESNGLGPCCYDEWRRPDSTARMAK